MFVPFLAGDDSASFWAAVERGGPVLATIVVISVIIFLFGKYLVTPMVQLIAQTASDFRIASETHRESQRESRATLDAIKEHEAMFGSRLRQAGEVIEEARNVLEPFKPKSGTHTT